MNNKKAEVSSEMMIMVVAGIVIVIVIILAISLSTKAGGYGKFALDII